MSITKSAATDESAQKITQHPLVGKLKAWGDFIIVKLDEVIGGFQSVENSNLIIPDQSRKYGKRMYTGLIIAIGSRKEGYPFKPGDRVIVNRHGGMEIEIGTERFLQLPDYDILAFE